jgi:TonB family protein
VTRYRIHLEERLLAPGTINVRLAAVRRLAYEAADTGLLSPDLAAGIRRVKGARKLGMRLGNWLTVEEARSLWQLPNMHTVKGSRDRAILAVLLGCGLSVKNKWHTVLPPSVGAGEQVGKNKVQFRVLQDGTVPEEFLKLVLSSGKRDLDEASLQAVRKAAPFNHLPEKYSAPFITLRFNFYYNGSNDD